MTRVCVFCGSSRGSDPAFVEAARATGNRMLVVEDHYPAGGLGDAVREAVAGAGVMVHHLAVREIPRSGPPRKLLERYGIGRGAIVSAVRGLIETPKASAERPAA